MQLVSVSTEGPVELQLYLEGLSSANDQLISVIQVSVMLLSVLSFTGAQQIHRTYWQLHFWGRKVAYTDLDMRLYIAAEVCPENPKLPSISFASPFSAVCLSGSGAGVGSGAGGLTNSTLSVTL